MRAAAIIAASLLLAAGVLGGNLAGQAAGAPQSPLAFAAATIKPATATDGHQHIDFDDSTHVRFINQPLDRLIEFAYGITGREFAGPDWLGGESFDVVAVAPAPATRQQMYAMLREFLIRQFALQAHQESRQEPVYALVVAKGGAKIVPTDQAGDSSTGTGPATGRIEMTRTVAEFARTLANYTDRPVIDQTGLLGTYRFSLSWTLDRPLNAAAASDPNAPPQLFTAMEEQLGLRLVPQRGPVDILVVDQCAKAPLGNQ